MAILRASVSSCNCRCAVCEGECGKPYLPWQGTAIVTMPVHMAATPPQSINPNPVGCMIHCSLWMGK